MRPRAFVAAFLLAFSGCAVSELRIGRDGMLLFSKTVVPLGFTGHGARYPAVRVEVGSKVCRLMLDTGSSGEAIALTSEALAAIDVTFTGRTRIYRDAYGGLSRSREFVIPTVRLGEFEVRNVLGNERHYSVYGLDGAIGLDLLSAFDLLIDYPGKALTLYRRNREPVFLEDGTWSRCSFAGNLSVRVGLDVCEGPFWFGLDTGCGCNLVSLDSDLGQALAADLSRRSGSFRLGRKRPRQYSSYRVDHLYVDGNDLGAGELVLCPLPSCMNDGLIGYDFYANHLVYITFRKQQIWFKRFEDRRSPPIAFGPHHPGAESPAGGAGAVGHVFR
jgi:hypothetical protein